jgi:phosphopantetheinyl transferase
MTNFLPQGNDRGICRHEASSLAVNFATLPCRLWCLKESYIKAVGIGLGFELTRAEFSYPEGYIWSNSANVRIDGLQRSNWKFSVRKLGDDHWVSPSLMNNQAVKHKSLFVDSFVL